jgi:hypothetical protein
MDMSIDRVTMSRNTEVGRIPVRSDRVFTQHNYWYFRTREGMDIGPFDSINDAVEGINGFIDFLDTGKPETVTRVREYVTHAA